MESFYRRWDEPRSLFGDVMVVSFVLMQLFDGVFTYLGVSMWGPAIEANPLVSSAVGGRGWRTAWRTGSSFRAGLGFLLSLGWCTILSRFSKESISAFGTVPCRNFSFAHCS